MVSMAAPERIETERIEIPALGSGAYSGSHRQACKRRSTQQAGAACAYAHTHREVPAYFPRLQRRVQHPGCLHALGCAMTSGQPCPRARGAPGQSGPGCSRLVPVRCRASSSPCSHSSWRQPCGWQPMGRCVVRQASGVTRRRPREGSNSRWSCRGQALPLQPSARPPPGAGWRRRGEPCRGPTVAARSAGGVDDCGSRSYSPHCS
jgi:hypothetical protein